MPTEHEKAQNNPRAKDQKVGLVNACFTLAAIRSASVGPFCMTNV